MKKRLVALILAGMALTGLQAVADEVIVQNNSQGRISYSMNDALPAYRAQAADGNPDAQMMMGHIYAMGDIVEADMHQAFYWFSKAAEQGVAEAQFKIAEMYLYGQGVERDLDSARVWARKAAEQSDANGEYLYGLMLAEGKGGLDEDWNRATVWLCRSANKGNQRAVDLLDTRTLSGEITESRGGEGVKDWCNCTAGRLSGC